MSKVNDLSSKECKNCRYDLLDEKRGCFIEFPIVYQLTTLFKKQNFYRDIQYRFSRKMSQKQYLRYLWLLELFTEKKNYSSWGHI